MANLPTMAISIRQPWAWAIIHAGKDIENRDWPTRFRGPVCIHAAKGMTRAEYEDASHFIRGFCSVPSPERLERGGIVGTAEIVGCVTQSESPWFFGCYGFVLRNVVPVDFIPARGALGFFDWRQNIIAPKAAAPAMQGSMF